MNSTGSLQASGSRCVHGAALDHANEFLERFPERRSDFMIFALGHAAMAAKNRQAIALAYLRLAWRARSWVAPRHIVANLRRMQRTTMKWHSQRVTFVPEAALEA